MKLSVIIPVYNRVSLLPVTLRCLLAQERVADEILVVDDGSTDGTAEVADAFDYPVRVIRQDNQGPGAARNRGLFEAQGEFIHFFDSDDLALPNLHRVQLETLESSKADVAYSPWVKARFDSLCGVAPTNHVFQSLGLPRGSLVQSLLTNWSTVPATWLIRARCLQNINGFPQNLFCGEDQLFFLSLLLNGARVLHTPDTLVLYRDEPFEKLSIPTSPSSIKLRARDWALTLLTMRHLCQAKGFDPASWFGFRRRVWSALDDIKCIDDDTSLIFKELEDIICSSQMPHLFYFFSRMLQQKGNGLTARVFGRRAHRTFRSAPMTPNQLMSANQVLRAALSK